MLYCGPAQLGLAPPKGTYRHEVYGLASTRSFFKRYWFLVAMAVVVPVGLVWPSGGQVISESPLAIPLLVAITLLISGFLLDARRLARQAANFRAILLTLSTTFVVAPVLGYALGHLLSPDGESALFLEAVMLTAAQASTLASALALTIIAGGDRELALILTLLSNALTVFLTPLVLDSAIGAQVSFPVAEMMGRMALVVLLPVVLGQALRRRFLTRVGDLRHGNKGLTALGFVPQLIMLCFIYTGFANARDELQDEVLVAVRLLAVAILLHGALLVWTRSLSKLLRLPEQARIAVILSGSQKTLPNGLYLWRGFFATNPYCPVALVLYHLCQLVVDTLLLTKLAGSKSRNKKSSPS